MVDEKIYGTRKWLDKKYLIEGGVSFLNHFLTWVFQANIQRFFDTCNNHRHALISNNLKSSLLRRNHGKKIGIAFIQIISCKTRLFRFTCMYYHIRNTKK